MWTPSVCCTRSLAVQAQRPLRVQFQPDFHVTIPESAVFVGMLPEASVMHMRMSPEVMLLLKMSILLA